MAELIQSLFTTVGKFFSKIFSSKLWRLSVTMILIIVYSINGIVMSVQTMSFEPFYDGVIKRVINADQQLYESSELVKESGGVPVGESPNFFDKVKAFTEVWGGVFFSLWFMYWFGWLIFKVTLQQNTSAVFSSVLFAVFGLALIIFVGNVIVAGGEGELTDKGVDEIGFRLLPFKGVWNLGSALPSLVNPLYEQINVNNINNPGGVNQTVKVFI